MGLEMLSASSNRRRVASNPTRRAVTTRGGASCKSPTAGISDRGVVPTPESIASGMSERLLRGVCGGRVWRVLDPGCGDARLLTAVLRQAALRGFEVACQGVEIDAEAARAARNRVVDLRQAAGAALRSWSVRHGDFLLERCRTDVDLAIANPPYVSWRNLSLGYRRQLSAPGVQAGDLSALFLDRILDRLRAGGRLCVIVPNKLLAARYAASLRRRLLAETCIEEIWDLSSERVFGSHAVYPVVLVARREPAPPTHRIEVRGPDGSLRARWSQAILRALPDALVPLDLDSDLLGMADRLLAGPLLGDRVQIRCGIAISGFGRGVGTGSERIIRSGNVRPFRVHRPPRFAPERAGIDVSRFSMQRVPKVVVPGMLLRLCAAFDSKGLLLGRAYFVPIEGPDTAARDARRSLLLALLNSRLYAVLYRGLYGAVAQSGGYTRVNAPYLARLPWPEGEPPAEIPGLVRRLEEGEDALTRSRLDACVETMFDLTLDERDRLGRLASTLPPVRTDSGRGRRPRSRTGP